MKKERGFEVTPLDLERIRKDLHLTLAEMGRRLQRHSQKSGNSTFVRTRVSEWQRGHRAVPGYVYQAGALVVLDVWRDVRHRVAHDRDELKKVDYRFGSLLSETFGELLRLEHDLSRKRSKEGRMRLIEIQGIRRMHQGYLERLLNVQMGYVFADNAVRN